MVWENMVQLVIAKYARLGIQSVTFSYMGFFLLA